MLINETAYNKLIANNLRRLANEHGVTQSDIAKKLDVSKATVSLWFNGRNAPRMDKIDALCQWWNIKRSDIMEGKSETKEVYVITPEDLQLIAAYHAATDEQRRLTRYALGFAVIVEKGEQ